MENEVPLADQLVVPLLQLLEFLRDAAGGDLEIHIVLLAIAARTVAHPDFRALTQEERATGAAEPFPTRGINIRSIADSTGMPRDERWPSSFATAGLSGRGRASPSPPARTAT